MCGFCCSVSEYVSNMSVYWLWGITFVHIFKSVLDL